MFHIIQSVHTYVYKYRFQIKITTLRHKQHKYSRIIFGKVKDKWNEWNDCKENFLVFGLYFTLEHNISY